MDAPPEERFEIRSPHSPEECARRILAAIDVERSAFAALGLTRGSKLVAGRIEGSAFRLRKRREYRNSFQPVLSATMVPHDAGTLVRGEFAMPAFTRAFIPIWLAGVGIFSALGLEIFLLSWFIGSPATAQNRWVGLVAPPLMLVFGIYFVRSGLRQARDEAIFLRDFLCGVLDAGSR